MIHKSIFDCSRNFRVKNLFLSSLDFFSMFLYNVTQHLILKFIIHFLTYSNLFSLQFSIVDQKFILNSQWDTPSFRHYFNSSYINVRPIIVSVKSSFNYPRSCLFSESKSFSDFWDSNLGFLFCIRFSFNLWDTHQ